MAVSGKKLVLWMCASVVAALLILDGAMKLFELHLMVAQFERFGYGTGALQAYGACELLAGLLLLAPAARLLAAGFAVFLMALAVFAYVSTSVPFSPAPVVVTAFTLALIWMHLEQRIAPTRKP